LEDIGIRIDGVKPSAVIVMGEVVRLRHESVSKTTTVGALYERPGRSQTAPTALDLAIGNFVLGDTK